MFALSILLALLSLFLLLIVFSTVCILCDQYLVPCVEVFIQVYEIPEEVAGEWFPFVAFCWFHFFPAVTLVAFGSACPELLLNTVGVLRNESDLSLPAIFGSAMIAFGLIPALCLLCNTQPEQKLHVWPILREVKKSPYVGFCVIYI